MRRVLTWASVAFVAYLLADANEVMAVLVWCALWGIGGTALVVVLYTLVEPQMQERAWRIYYRASLKLARRLTYAANRTVRRGDATLVQVTRFGEILWNAGIAVDPRKSHWVCVRAGVLDWDCATAHDTRHGGYLTIPQSRRRAAARARLAEHSATDQSPDLTTV